MPTGSCHCGSVKVHVPHAASSLTSCNCSLCRRYGVLWAYYETADVKLIAKAGATESYAWGRKSQEFVRCKTCGCVMLWRKFKAKDDAEVGVNARNFDPSEFAGIEVRLLDGAKTWKYLGKLKLLIE